jgi:hypothetical protein
LGALLNAFALEPEIHRNTIPGEGSSSNKNHFKQKSAVLTNVSGAEHKFFLIASSRRLNPASARIRPSF